MVGRGFAAPGVGERLARAVKDIEGRTSAEVVVAVRRLSGDYAAADLRFGILLAFGALLAVYGLPHAFDDAAFVLDPAFFFLVGAFAARYFPALRRLLTPPARRRENVRVAARAAFVDLGVGRLKGQNGVLVFASLLERSVEVVSDAGIDVGAMGRPWQEAVKRLQDALGSGPDVAAFDEALRSLGPTLQRVLPREDDDVNELPDEVGVE
jgi:putative membrane protein